MLCIQSYSTLLYYVSRKFKIILVTLSMSEKAIMNDSTIYLPKIKYTT